MFVSRPFCRTQPAPYLRTGYLWGALRGWAPPFAEPLALAITLLATVTSVSAVGLTTLREENRRLRSLVDFSRHVTAERDVRAQLRLLCAELRRTTRCTAAAVILLDPARRTAATITSTGP